MAWHLAVCSAGGISDDSQLPVRDNSIPGLFYGQQQVTANDQFHMYTEAVHARSLLSSACVLKLELGTVVEWQLMV